MADRMPTTDPRQGGDAKPEVGKKTAPEGGPGDPPAADVEAEAAVLAAKRAQEERLRAKAKAKAKARALEEHRNAQRAPAQIINHPAIDMRAAQRAAPRRRHRIGVLSFLVAVMLPALASVGYLYAFAADQYASRVAFSVRSAESETPVEFLGALTRTIGGSIGPDAEIIYAFIRSQRMVERAMAALPLEAIFNVPGRDIVFRLGEDQPIEDVTRYWNWMTDVSFDASTGIVEFEVRTFDPESAERIAAFVLDESTDLVNRLSLAARNDAVRLARGVLDEAEARLRDVRLRIRAFRDVEQQLDPTENARAALGLVSGLEGELANAEVELDAQLKLVGERSPRIPVLRQRIASLKARIAEERSRLGAGSAERSTHENLSRLLADYEELAVEREFAENAYVSALRSYEQAQIETRRQMRYLAAHIAPTRSVEAQYPRRWLIALTVFLALSVTWAVLLLIAYNVRDRH
jgi:capsular polysaccharide transport system permease protein